MIEEYKNMIDRYPFELRVSWQLQEDDEDGPRSLLFTSEVWDNFCDHIRRVRKDENRSPARNMRDVLSDELAKYNGINFAYDENYGPFVNNEHIHFKTEQDRTFFVLKWT